MIGCLWFSHTTRLTPKSNGSYYRTFAFYQWMNKLDVSFHTVYKRDVSLRNMLVHSTDHTSIKQPGSRACQRPRCNTCCHISWVAVIRGPKSVFTIYADAHFFALVRLEETLGVVSANICEVYATTLPGFLWPIISAPLATVSLMSRCVV